MLVLSKALTTKPIASVQSGHRVAVSGAMLIDPRNLKVFAFHASTPQKQDLVLHAEDIRGVTPQGLIIDDNDQLMSFDDDLVRLKEVNEINFHLIDKPVYTEHKKKIGKVTDFVTETEGFMITKLHVNRSLAKSFGVSQLIINRSQIVQVTDDKIIVKSTAIKEKSGGLKQTFFGKSPSLNANTIKSNSSETGQ